MERDLLFGPAYELTNTGQGLNRVQRASGLANAMHQIITATKEQLGYWIGSDMVHLGDHNVPNGLMFIDKYTQIPR